MGCLSREIFDFKVCMKPPFTFYHPCRPSDHFDWTLAILRISIQQPYGLKSTHVRDDVSFCKAFLAHMFIENQFPTFVHHLRWRVL